MSRWEFMRQLEELLSDISPSEREEALQYYNDYFNDAGKENESQVMEALGTPEQVAGIVKDGLAGNAGEGEFTENGYESAGREKQNAVIKRPSQPDENNSAQTGKAEPSGNTGSRAAAAAGESRRESTGAQSGAYGRNAAGAQNGAYSQNAAGAQNGAYSRNTAGAQSGAYSQNAAGAQNGAYSQSAANAQTSAGGKEKKGLPTWAIVLIVIGCVIFSPVILGVAGTLLGVIVSIFVAVISLIFGLGLTAVILFVVAVALFIAAFACILASPISAIALMGGACICAAVGILFLLVVVFLVGKCIPGICQGIGYIFGKLFGKKEGSKA